MNVIQTDWGIGDVICSLYAIQGYARRYPDEEINFYLRQHFDWARLADIPNMQLKTYSDDVQFPAEFFFTMARRI